MFVYLDTNVYCRPFDDQKQLRIRKETDVFEKILDYVKEGKIHLISSDILVYEVSNILRPHKRIEIEEYICFCIKRVEENEEIKELAILIRGQCGTKNRDALHIASAIFGNARYYLTCDDSVNKKKSAVCIKKIANEYGKDIKVLNPKDFRFEEEKVND